MVAVSLQKQVAHSTLQYRSEGNLKQQVSDIKHASQQGLHFPHHSRFVRYTFLKQHAGSLYPKLIPKYTSESFLAKWLAKCITRTLQDPDEQVLCMALCTQHICICPLCSLFQKNDCPSCFKAIQCSVFCNITFILLQGSK